jgi:hypothetical protein
VRESLAEIPKVEEKEIFRGLTFMVNDKMCVSMSGNELMLRIDPELTEKLLEEDGTPTDDTPWQVYEWLYLC